MNRRESREKAFLLLFENTFKPEYTEQLISDVKNIRGEKISSFSLNLFSGTVQNIEDIDIYIEKHLKGWKKERLSRVVLSILRLAVFEMIYEKEMPNSVCINEAVELAKKYAYKEDASFINGVLGSLDKEISKQISN